MNIPEDCVVVKLAKGITGVHVSTWRIHGDEEKTIPVDFYQEIKDKLRIVDDPHNLVIKSMVEKSAAKSKKH